MQTKAIDRIDAQAKADVLRIVGKDVARKGIIAINQIPFQV